MKRRRSSSPPPRPLPKRGYGIRPGVNKPLPMPYATPEFAARQAEPHWTIFDWATGATVGEAREFQS